jgi:UDP-N-acetylmuramate--L-alanine ligase
MNDLTQRLIQRDAPLRIHLIGVAGSGMSGLALLLLGMGHRVSGSDRVTTAETERMQGLGLIFSSPHTAAAVVGVEVVVYSSAIRPANPAYAAAVELGLPLFRRAECLAAILHAHRGVIIAGTHGKTTTSAMTAHALREAGLNPSHYVGAEIPILGSNARWSDTAEFMVAEGDESDGTLVLYRPVHAVILNIEAEHLDYYRDLDHIREVFSTLADQTTGNLVYCIEDPVAHEVCANRANAISYGWEDADFTATGVREFKGSSAFTVTKNGEVLGDIELGIPGRHNILNALAAIALADSCGAAFALVARALASFAGAKRRFETKYLSANYHIIDDYGHHPSELAATLQTARSLKPKRLIVLFQPHRYTRTQALAEDFGKERRMYGVRFLFTGLALVASVASAQTTVGQPGRLLASNCFQCHGTNGKGPGFDSLAGKSSSEIYKELKEFQSGKEGNGIMARHAMGYTDAQMQLIANWFASQK